MSWVQISPEAAHWIKRVVSLYCVALFVSMTKTWFAEFLYTKWTGVVSDSAWDSFQVEDHSRNSVNYLKGLRILVLESLEALKMYYA